MNVTFRTARTSDRETYDWKLYGLDQLRPTVVTYNGKIALVIGENMEVLYQNGAEGIADLVRAVKNVHAAIQGQYDFARAETARERRKQMADMMAGFREAGFRG